MKFDPATGEFIPDEATPTAPPSRHDRPVPSRRRRGCADRFMDFISLPMCLFLFPFLGVLMIQKPKNLWHSILGVGLVGFSVLMWVFCVINVFQWLFKKNKNGSRSRHIRKTK